MKIEMSFLAAFLLIGTDLLARASVHGVEPALVSTAVQYGSAGLNRLSRWVTVEVEIVVSLIKQMSSKESSCLC
jgi:hypothetical protein